MRSKKTIYADSTNWSSLEDNLAGVKFEDERLEVFTPLFKFETTKKIWKKIPLYKRIQLRILADLFPAFFKINIKK